MRERKEMRGAFFGSIHGTLNHLLWGDQIWMSRFAGTPRANIHCRAVGRWQLRRLGLTSNVNAPLRRCRDQRLGRPNTDGWLVTGDLTWYSGTAKRDITKPRWLLVTHMFNHQTHHRGQVHCMLTQAGAKPDDTDITLLPPA